MFCWLYGKLHNNTVRHQAYTLAEMLIVLVIVSIILISLPHATKKLFTVKEVKTYHGRYECYWDRSSGQPKLKYYYAKERPGLEPQIEEGYVDGNRCEFVPPSTYPYMMFHAVGGGGAGGNLTDSIEEPTILSFYTEYLPNTEWSTRWFVKFMDSLSSSEKAAYYIDNGTWAKDVYSTMVTYRQVVLNYRKSGGAGRVSSMFFPSLPPGNKFYLYPGKGGDLQAQNQNGEDGGDSVVQIINGSNTCDVEDENASCNIIFAHGGKGAVVLGSDGNVIPLSINAGLSSGKLSDMGISAYSDVKGNLSGFDSVIDKMNKTETLASQINSDAGNGGNGANQYIKNAVSGFYYHEFDDFKTQYCYTDGVQRPCKGGEVGVKWVPVSGKVNASNAYSKNCTNKSTNLSGTVSGIPASGLWIERSALNDISTQCVPSSTTSTPAYFYCTVGYMVRNFVPSPSASVSANANSACESSSKGNCACYVYRLSGTTYYLYTTTNNFTSSGNLTQYYKDPIFNLENTYKATLKVKERVPDNSNYIYCNMESTYAYGSSPCENNKSFNTTKGICNAKRGGDGAIVILW